ncbi:hypothetical protein PGTUg99_028186 [Puccinia graminis f. sp. tritici]|uniref:Stress response protein NST1 n=1 Tax=Puccinia graminis f. sp. tritici TaxID=56615 RepID=A0A5B0N0H3_PUCGR|nr:hypothetical protein PGTUg99_028186 [Puccinia graminis f. sp. tritici]
MYISLIRPPAGVELGLILDPPRLRRGHPTAKTVTPSTSVQPKQPTATTTTSAAWKKNENENVQLIQSLLHPNSFWSSPQLIRTSSFMAKKTQPSRSAASALQSAQQQKNQKPSLPPPPSPPSLAPKSKTSGAAKKKNKKKAAQARQLDSINHLDQLNDNHTDSNSLIGRSDMIGAYPAEDAVSITQRTTTGSISPDEDEDDRITSHTMHPSLAAATRQTQEDLLATANDLYRQIESAAAAALATTQYPKSNNSIHNSNNQNQSSTNHQSGHSNSNNHSPHPDDDAYWNSLPAHLRSFIRSALPLAAGHSSSNSNQSQSSAQNPGAILPNLSSFAHATGMVTSTTTSNNQQSVPQLTSEQMAAAAEQLARVVQSHDWGRAVSTAAQQAGLSHTSVMNHIINGTARSSHNYSRDGSGAAATLSVTGGTVTGTIPLGSFTLPLPLHAHPEQHQHQNSHGINEPVYYTGETTIVTSRIGDKHNGDDGLLDDGYYSDDARGMRGDINHTILDNRHNHSEQASNASNIGVNNSSPAMTTTTSNKKKKKNKKKKSGNAGSNEATQPPPVPSIDVQRSAPTLPSNPGVPTKASPQINSSTRKPGLDPPGVQLTNQTLSPNAAAPASRLPPVPPSAQKKKSPIATSLSSNVNNSASSSTVTNTNSNNTSHQPTERERIRVFWLTLNQEERANLVKIEKDAVLKKMKEQQRHSCSCAVCGRKRLAIEQELEVLYDAYYDELENYAEASKKYYGSDLKTKGDKGLPGAYPKPPGPGPFPGSVDIMMTATQPSTQVASKKAVPKPTRDHKNIRPRPQQAVPQQTHPPPQSTNGTNGHYQQPPGAAKRNLPPPSQLKKLNSHNSNSDHDHTHSPSCPHHPHHHGPNHYHPNNRGKGVANAHCIPPAAHPRTHPRNEDAFPDEDAEDEEDEDEYDDDDEEEYDEDEEEEGEFEDDDEIPALEEVPSETLVPNNAHKKPPINGTNMPYPNKLPNGDKPSSTHANNSDLFGFGNSLTVKGGILTVADDLLRNDGQKFLEMMESLADKRIQRERDAAENLLAGLEDDENDGDDYDEDEEEDDELDDDDGFDDEIITEEYRMKEGRRMFQIFAARMFEQRVLTAYREKVAQEKQAQLLRELEDEDRLAQERELKKVKDAQKKKEKKKAQKQQKDQDLAKKLKDKEAEEQAAKAAEEARLEAEKRKQEEQRIKREAQRKLQEAERAKKEEERKKRIEEETRKRKEKEEKIRQEKEARVAKEKEEREKKAREEAERKAKLELERKEKEAKEAKAKEELARKKKAETAKREAEEAAKREAAKTAAAKLAAQNKNVTPNAKPNQRSPVSVRSPMTPKPINTSIKMPPSSGAHNLPIPNPNFPPHTPNRPMLPPPMLPRQMSVGIGLGRPASAAAAPPFSAAVPPMAGPSSYSNIPTRPPSAQYSTSFPASNAYAPPGCLQNIPPDMHVPPMNGIQAPLVGGPFMPMGSFQPPMGPMMPSINSRAFSGSAIPITPQHNYVNQTSQSHQPSQHQRPSIVSSLPPSTPTHPSGLMSPGISSASSPLSALHLGSEPVSKATVSAVGPIGPSSTQQPRRPSGIDEALAQGGFFSNSIEPIGRPKLNGTSNAMEVLSGQSDRDSTPDSADTSPTRSSQNVLGSSALLADDEAGANFPRRHTMPTNITPTSRKTSCFPAPPGFDRGLVVGNSIWGTSLPAGGGDSGWGAAVLSTPPPSVVTPRTPLQPSSLGGVVQPSGANPPRENTSDWIRRRAISAYCNMRLNEKWIPVGDVSIEMQRIHLDTLNVSLKDMVDACLIKRNIHNGGGDWQFSQQGPVLYTRWLPVSSQEVSLGTSNLVS